MNLTEHAADALLDGGSIPATLYLQLHTGNPGTAGADHVSQTSDRKAFTRTAAAVGASSNDADLEWSSAAADENLTHASVWDASSAGNPWWIGELAGSPVPVLTGVPIEVAAGDLDLAFEVWS